jgi:hypothetical protein
MAICTRLFLVSILLAGGCNRESSQQDLAVVNDAQVADEGACHPTCDASSCKVGEVCLSALPIFPVFSAFCAKTCQFTADCPAGSHCVEVTRDVDPTGRFCLNDVTPTSCAGPLRCSSFTPGHCNGDVSVLPFEPTAMVICGNEYTNCGDAGCSGSGVCGR